MDADIEAIVEDFWAARNAGDHFPATYAGKLDFETALEVQLGQLRHKIADGEALGGWKIGLTNEPARRSLGSDERPFGHILASRVLRSGDHVAASAMRKGNVEPELCFTIGTTLSGSAVSPDDARAAVARIAAGFELNERRKGSAPPEFHLMVADGMANWGIVEGDGVTAVDDIGAVAVTFERNGEIVDRAVSGEVLDNHWESLARLARELDRFDVALESGMKVITGAFCRSEIAPGDHWRAIYDGIGTVEINVD